MAVNLFDLVKGQFSDSLMGKVGGLLGESAGNTGSAFDSVLSSVLGGVINKGSSTSGASDLLKVLGDGKHDGGILDNLGDLLGGGAKTDGLMKTGSSIISYLMGNKTNAILDILGKVTGIKRGSSSMLMNLLAPVVMGQIGKIVKNKALSATGLMDLLKGQRSTVQSSLPAGMGGLLGFADGGSSTSRTETVREVKEEASTGGGGGFFKWLIPLLLGVLLLGYLFKGGCAGTDTIKTGGDTTEVENKLKGDKDLKRVKKDANAHEGHSHDGHDHAGHSHDGHDHAGHSHGTVDKAGEIAGAAGKVATDGKDALKGKLDGAAAKAEMMVNDAGDLVDADGKVLFKKGAFEVKDGYYVDGSGKKIGKVFAKIKDAVAGAAGKTAEFFTGTFSGLFKKKGTGATHTLSKITFDDDSQKITNFSKAEVEGLAAALKADKTAKIEVQAYTNDGGGDANNKTLSTMRAKVVRDMLVTLGVGKDQISASGMSAKDATKAAANKIEIMVK